MQKMTACVWCWKLMPAPKGYNEKKHKGVCCRGCRDAETLFNIHFSDEEMHRRAHYRHLTRGEEEDGEA